MSRAAPFMRQDTLTSEEDASAVAPASPATASSSIAPPATKRADSFGSEASSALVYPASEAGEGSTAGGATPATEKTMLMRQLTLASDGLSDADYDALVLARQTSDDTVSASIGARSPAKRQRDDEDDDDDDYNDDAQVRVPPIKALKPKALPVQRLNSLADPAWDARASTSSSSSSPAVPSSPQSPRAVSRSELAPIKQLQPVRQESWQEDMASQGVSWRVDL